jgi:hypothetical protein
MSTEPKAFYVERVGFNADHDHSVRPGLRFVQLTPPGSACSIVIGDGLLCRPRRQQLGTPGAAAPARAGITSSLRDAATAPLGECPTVIERRIIDQLRASPGRGVSRRAMFRRQSIRSGPP